MSNKQLQNALDMASNLCKDTAGNLLSGNEIRAMGYLKALQHTIDAARAKQAAGNDVRAEMKLDAAIKSINVTLDEEHAKHPFDGSKVQESMAKWEAAGYTMADFAKGLNEDEMNAAGIKPGVNGNVPVEVIKKLFDQA